MTVRPPDRKSAAANVPKSAPMIANRTGSQTA